VAFARQKPAGIGVNAPFPGFIEPALATSIEKVPSGERWIHEIKFDGYSAGFTRCTADRNYPRARRSAASNRSFSLSHRASSVCDFFSRASTSAWIAAARFACSCSALSNAACALSTAC
jgi:hypothetical protein